MWLIEGHFCSLKPLYPFATVVRVHDGAYGGVIRGDVNGCGPVDITKTGCTEVC